MQWVSIHKNTMPGKHWLVYTNENKMEKYVDLSGCANSFSLATGNTSEDGMRVVGYRYEENGCLCYELYTIGHVVLYVPLKMGILRRIGYLLRGTKPKEAHREYLLRFETALNAGGWKTVERDGGKV